MKMNLPNTISFFRLLLVPIIIILMLVNQKIQFIIGSYHISILWFIAGTLFIIAALSDWLDGYLARKRNKVTTFGKFFDAIADKLLSSAVLITMSYLQIIPIWLTLILILRDFLIDAVRQILASQQIIVPANWFGKWKFTFFLIGTIIMFFFNYTNFTHQNNSNNLYGEYGIINQVLMIPLYITVILSIFSAFVYIKQNKQYLNAQ